MIQFNLQQDNSKELEFFPHVRLFSLSKSNTVQLGSFNATVSDDLRVYYIVEGKFDWVIDDQKYTLYPDDVALVLPGWRIGGENGAFGIGSVFQLHIKVEKPAGAAGISLGSWSGLEAGERLSIPQLLLVNNVHVLKVKWAVDILGSLHSELTKREIGYRTRVNQLIDSLIILIARQSTNQFHSQAYFSIELAKLEQTLRARPGHEWTVEEMAALFGLGTTTFTEKVKAQTGFSPLNYLINIRISEAMKLLQDPHASITNVALETGFYSSQHFSTTFKKLTGYTPGEYRKKNVLSTGVRLSSAG